MLCIDIEVNVNGTAADSRPSTAYDGQSRQRIGWPAELATTSRTMPAIAVRTAVTVIGPTIGTVDRTNT